MAAYPAFSTPPATSPPLHTTTPSFPPHLGAQAFLLACRLVNNSAADALGGGIKVRESGVIAAAQRIRDNNRVCR
jgi:hypothetical protein